MSKELFRQKTKDDIHEILMNLNRGRLAVSQAHEQIFNILEQPSEADSKDTELLDWIEQMMTPDNDYCEIFFAGLRDFKSGKATSFQIESNPERFPVLHGNSLRDAIKMAMDQCPCKTDYLPDIRKKVEPTKTAEQILKERFSCTCDEAYKSRRLTDPNCIICELGTEIIDMMEEYRNQAVQLPSEEEINEKYPSEFGDSVIMESGKSYEEVVIANRFRKEGAKWIISKLTP